MESQKLYELYQTGAFKTQFASYQRPEQRVRSKKSGAGAAPFIDLNL
jgi:hypothetical protein